MPGKLPSSHEAIYDEEAELSVIGSILLDSGWFNEVDLDPEDFFLDDYRKLFQAMLSLRDRGENINEISLARAIVGEVELWFIPHILSVMATPLDCIHYSRIVKDLSDKRKLVAIAKGLTDDIKKGKTTSRQLVDRLRAELEAITFQSKNSRTVIFSNSRIVTSEPPTYLVTVTSMNSKKAVDIRFTSSELDNSTAFKRKIREKLNINPILPKSFDSLVDMLVRQAKAQFAPKDASAEEQICILIRDWFKSAIEAEHVEDLTQGYIEKEGAYWFSSTKMLKYLSDKAKVKMNPERLWPIISSRGGRRSKVFRLGDNTARLWGLDKKFFEAEAEEPIEGEQIPLGDKEGEEDLSWLEG